ncbi:hypothetical protein ACNKHK_17450 [Shigella flexneri]
MREQAEARGIKTLVFGGGVMHSRLFVSPSGVCLHFTFLCPQRYPAGDGGLSLGQGVICRGAGGGGSPKQKHPDKWQRASLMRVKVGSGVRGVAE